MTDFLTPETAARRDEARALLNRAEALWRAGDRGRLPEAWRACEAAMTLLPAEAVAQGRGGPLGRPVGDVPAEGGRGGPSGPALPVGNGDCVDPFAEVRASGWLMRGRLLVAREAPEAVVEGLRCFDQAIGRMQALAGGGGPELAITWMNRGGALLRLGAPESFKEAVRSYERAIAQLGEAPPDDFLNALGAAWMNRGIGLLALGDDESRAEAGRSLDRAVAILEPLVAARPVVRRNLAATWAARADLREAGGDAPGSMSAQSEAVAIFRPLLDDDAPMVRAEFAGLLLRLARAHQACDDDERAPAVAREALTLLALVEAGDLACARQALRARHALGALLGGRLAKNPERSAARDAQLAEASDLAEEGLALIRARGADGAALAGEGARLFELGAWLYRTQQPQFLAEFLTEHVGDDPVRAKIAGEAVRLARQDIVQRGFAGAGSDMKAGAGDLERSAGILGDLTAVEARLRAIASAATTGNIRPN